MYRRGEAYILLTHWLDMQVLGFVPQTAIVFVYTTPMQATACGWEFGRGALESPNGWSWGPLMQTGPRFGSQTIELWKDLGHVVERWRAV